MYNYLDNFAIMIVKLIIYDMYDCYSLSTLEPRLNAPMA
jgi:hypothetical protein